ncbi:glycerate kinase [Paracoccus sp. NGMCC 1.201697]|uniref:Glycerate kinase n=1 Tax=Paracoccus broussonetiae subsp. drimophilus TaxID=3373869 RepID=A0ABW7LNQ9_9RHOB
MRPVDRAMDLIRAGIAAADPAAAVRRGMAEVLADPPGPGGRWQVIALGKAARAMAEAALAFLPGAGALVVTNAGNDAPLDGARVLRAGHPQPDAEGAAAAAEVEGLLRATVPHDRVLALISGGGSAMLPAPSPGMTLADKQDVNRLLLGSGADIAQVNLIRQNLSRLKGGGWLRLSPAPIVALILSDVPGDDLRVIASGPTVAPVGGRAEAVALARQLGIWDRMPETARAALLRPDGNPALPSARNILVGSNSISVTAMVEGGATAAPIPLEGDVQECAEAIWRLAPSLEPGQALALGGETTVRLTGDGMGGRNQELALRLALLAEARPVDFDWAFASVGSDGRDGPGEAAGGLVGPGTPAAIRAGGIDPLAALARNDSTPALQAGGALVMTGPTGTNVADLAVLVRA